jgi:very-short-patch-repair endonuclease
MSHPSPLAGEGGARAEGVGGRGGAPTLFKLQQRAKWMRTNPTDAERKLWSMVRARRLADFKFKRQQILFPYIVDFVCFEHRLIVEADGGQHSDNRSDEQRDSFLRSEDFRVLRFWNNDVLANASGVYDAICQELMTPHPPTAARRAPPSPARGEGFGVADA